MTFLLENTMLHTQTFQKKYKNKKIIWKI